MSNNVPITPGTGASIATDDVSGVHYQVVKLAVGTEDSASRVDGSNPLPVSDAGGSLTVDGTVSVSNFPGTQAVSGTVTVQDGGAAVSVDDNGGSLTVDGTVAVSGTVPVTDNGGSLTVDGTLTANIGTTNGLALDATLTGGSQKAKLVDSGGTNVAAVSAAGAVKVDGSAVTQPVSGTVSANLNAGANAIGKLAANDAVDIGDVTVNNGTGAAAVNIQDGGNSITVDGSVGVSGTVTANVGTTNGLALDATLTGGAQKAITRGGAKGSTTAADVTSVAVDGNTQALHTSVTNFPATQPVSGTFWQATQPVSLASGATAIAKAEDVASADADVGVPAMAIRKATPANTSGTDGDYEMLQMSAGRLWASATIDAALPAGTNAIGKLAANDGVDVGDVTINNAAGASAVNVQDGGNSLTIDQATAANLNAQIVGAAATDAVVSGNPVLTAGRAQNALPSAVSADGDVVPASFDRQGVTWVRPRQLASYLASYRLANATAGQLSLTFTFSANTDKQLATIYHPNTATKIVKIRRVSLWVSTGAAGVFGFEIKPLSATTAPATGNPAITPGKFDPADSAAEATCLALPTTAGSLVATDSPVSIQTEWNAAAATAAANPSGIAEQEIILFDSEIAGMEMKPLTIRAGTAEGYAVVGRSTTAVALRFTVAIWFTEE